MLMGNISGMDLQIPHEVAQYWGWFLAFGLALVVLGVAAIVRAVSATIISMLFFGWLLLLACGIEIAQAVLVGHWAGFFQHLVAAILFGVVGVIIITRPLISAEVMTVFIATFLLIGGLFQLISALAVHASGWGWHVADGLITAPFGARLPCNTAIAPSGLIGSLRGRIASCPGTSSAPATTSRSVAPVMVLASRSRRSPSCAISFGTPPA